jgi:stage II sporulation protein AA (anti-sigma F factor antagonist)
MREQPQLSIQVTGDAPVVIRLAGELDMATAPALADALSAVDGEDVVVDCDALSFLDSSGISVLVGAHRDGARTGHHLTLRDVGGTPRRSLEICGLTEILALDDTGSRAS